MKKLIFLYCLSLMIAQVLAQTKTVSIYGTVKDTAVKSIKITHPNDAELIHWGDTETTVINGEFNMPLEIYSYPVQIHISYNDKSYSPIFVDNDTKILIDSAGNMRIIGSGLQDEYENQFLPFFEMNNRQYDSYRDFYRKSYDKYGEELPKSVKDSAALLGQKYYYEKFELLNRYIKLHPGSYVALWSVSDFLSMPNAYKYFDFERLFSSLSAQMQQQPFVLMMMKKLESSKSLAAGQIFPKEFFKGYEQMHSKITENNQYYLIDFWYSHCGPCIAGFPKLKKIYNQFHDKGFEIVSVSVDKQEDEVDYVAAIKKYELSWSHIWDKDGVTSSKFSIHTFPRYILLNKEGKIINNNIRESELEEFLKEKL